MRFQVHNGAISFFAIVLLIQCSQPSIYGHWKPQQIVIDTKRDSQITYDLSNTDKLTREMFQRSWEKDTGTEEDSIYIMNEIRTIISNSRKAELIIERNNKYTLYNHDLIVSTAYIPGWHINDTIIGNWALQHDTLTLSIENDIFNFDWRFKIINLTSKELLIQDATVENYDKSRELLLRKR